MRALLLAFALLLAAVPAVADPQLPAQIEAQNGPEKLTDQALEARAVALQKTLRCMVCAGESLDESSAPLASDLRRLIRKQILEGRSDDEIRAFLVARYGNVILMKPPVIADTYLLWFGPALVLLAAAGVATLVIRRAGQRL